MRPPDEPSGENDCLRRAVSALFELPLEEVPHFIEEVGRQWPRLLNTWAQARGYRVHCASYLRPGGAWLWTDVRRALPSGYYVGIIAPNSGRAHAVVMRGAEVAYDPAGRRRSRYQKVGMGVIEFVPAG